MPAAEIMPNVSGTGTEATIVEWFKKEGDQVKQGEPLFQIETEKATVEVEATGTGRLHRILVGKGVAVAVATPVAVIAEPNDQESAVDAFVKQLSVGAPPAAKPSQEAPQATRSEAPSLARASPSARRLARELHVDLAKVKPSGDIIVEKDVRQAAQGMGAAGAAPALQAAKTVPLEGIRKITAQRMTESIQQIPQLTLMRDADVTDMAARYEKGEPKNGRPPYLPILIKAAAKALQDNPILNSTLKGDHIELFESVNIGIAIATDQGLVVAVLKNAEKKSFSQIVNESGSLVQKAVEKKLELEDVSGGTFTITNMGPNGISLFTPVINPPQAAILGLGRAEDRPAVVEGKIVVRRVLPLSLTFDHRITDGAPAAKFLENLIAHINSPHALD